MKMKNVNLVDKRQCRRPQIQVHESKNHQIQENEENNLKVDNEFIFEHYLLFYFVKGCLF